MFVKPENKEMRGTYKSSAELLPRHFQPQPGASTHGHRSPPPSSLFSAEYYRLPPKPSTPPNCHNVLLRPIQVRLRRHRMGLLPPILPQAIRPPPSLRQEALQQPLHPPPDQLPNLPGAQEEDRQDRRTEDAHPAYEDTSFRRGGSTERLRDCVGFAEDRAS